MIVTKEIYDSLGTSEEPLPEGCEKIILPAKEYGIAERCT